MISYSPPRPPRRWPTVSTPHVIPGLRPPRTDLKGHIHDVEGEGGNVVMVVVGWPAPASNHQCRPGGSYMGHWFLCRGNHRWACITWACPDREPLPHRERDGMHPSPAHTGCNTGDGILSPAPPPRPPSSYAAGFRDRGAQQHITSRFAAVPLCGLPCMVIVITVDPTLLETMDRAHSGCTTV